jgi:hypothetical protein
MASDRHLGSRHSLRRYLLLACLTLMPCLCANGEPRFALVIGNGNYGAIPRLINPANDASDVARALRGLGFNTELLIDADLPGMVDGVERLGGRLGASSDALGFFFYAGHGVQSGGANYLIPVDAYLPGESYLRSKTLAAQEVLDSLQQAHNRLNVVVLDACRDNPFGWARSGSRGLAVANGQPTGSIIVYATGAGGSALDGINRNGVFTGELLKQLSIPGIEIGEVFKRTGAAVQAATHGDQVPAVYNQFFGDVYLAGPPGPAAAPSPGATTGAPAASAPPAGKPLAGGARTGDGTFIMVPGARASIRIDGWLSPGEWDGVAPIPFAVRLPEGGTTPGELYIAHDSVNLYVAVRFERKAADPGNSLALEFDGDGDGRQADGDDALVVGTESRLVDIYRTDRPPVPKGQIWGLQDIDDRGSNDGEGAFLNRAGFDVYELSHPLDSGDTGHDFALGPGSTVGMQVQIRMIAADAEYPAGFGDTTFPMGFQQLTIGP